MILMRHGESEFNVVYKRTRVDPGIRDPKLTPLGRHQVAEASAHLDSRPITHILTSPYTRAIETASIVAKRIAVPIHVDTRIGERAAFACDVGTSGGVCVYPCEKSSKSSPTLAPFQSSCCRTCLFAADSDRS